MPGELGLVARWVVLLAGIALVALGSGFYLGAALGPGPRDGLMTGLHRVTQQPIGVTRTVIEVGALTGGWLLGGTVGIGTLIFALAIGRPSGSRSGGCRSCRRTRCELRGGGLLAEGVTHARQLLGDLPETPRDLLVARRRARADELGVTASLGDAVGPT